MNYFRETCSHLLNTLLPQRCELCQTATGNDAPLCLRCRQAMPTPPQACCPRCGDFSAAGVVCGHCLSSPPNFDRVISPFLYAEPVDRMVQALKYRHQLALAVWFGAQLLNRLRDRLPSINGIDALLPMPLHPTRLRERGFNQSLEISRPIARGLDKPLLTTAVERIRNTAPQATLPREARHHNICGAFECRRDFSGQSLLVVDDVLTTGSSAGELARILKLHGARQVIIAVAARTHHPH